ncbi:high frequency lysogenization protein HflD [Suttonella sp. R2A3]|uniref:high frequency lysogenization protein HflD n=1 Tax=Suttonella sp. R2A3 TaxID=2908648 RepID=UPI001F299EB0|nr:high frequency lysogenization protein HflD [Suttonella sp. R2A3]UJF23832.1 high frequency lysogenization protein HflD [Suttonella sp. R2A3]
MSDTTLNDQAWCLSALFSAINGVRDLAHTGHTDKGLLEALLPCLLQQNAAVISDYFGNPELLDKGRQLLTAMFQQDVDSEYVRYSVQLMHVEKKLSKNRALMAELLDGLADVRRQTSHFPPTHENVLANIASVYQRTASEAAPKIMVGGNEQYLQQQAVIDQIRALLLCAIRVIALWRANGGNRWQLMFSRKAILEAAESAF